MFHIIHFPCKSLCHKEIEVDDLIFELFHFTPPCFLDRIEKRGYCMPEQSNSRSQAGKILGSAKTESKARAARANGEKGGRPAGSSSHSTNGTKKQDKDEDKK